MNKSFKHILLAITRLPVRDQRWIIQHLPTEQRLKFKKLHGNTLLKQAQRFRDLPHFPTQPQETPLAPLPSHSMQLATYAPLYIAIILEQGAYAWTEQFLKQFDVDNRIRNALEQQTTRIKPLVKAALFHDWEQLSSFDRLLEDGHG